MTPQSSFIIFAPIDSQRRAACRELLASMNDASGLALPDNALIPFGRFEGLHFARILVLDDQTVDDASLYDLPLRDAPIYLVLLGDVDGDAQAFQRQLVREAAEGLRAIFSCCVGFERGMDLLQWLRDHEVRAATTYGNRPGRTMLQIREEAALHEALRTYLAENDLAHLSPRDVHARLRDFVANEQAEGRLRLTAPAATPLGWWCANALHLIGVPLLLLAFSIPLAIVAAIVLLRIRLLEQTDREQCPRVPAERVAELAAREDHDVTNQFSAVGSLKPGLARSLTVKFVLWLVDYTTRHVYLRGRLARVRTIHFAHWVPLDGGRRLLFTSNYDGSRESYMDDFINKAAFGLNVVFSSGIGYPTTRWLVMDGAKDEQKFKNFLRRHQLPTDVWYNAHPGLTAVDLERNSLVRQSIESPALGEQEARDWVALL